MHLDLAVFPEVARLPPVQRGLGKKRAKRLFGLLVVAARSGDFVNASATFAASMSPPALDSRESIDQ